MKEDEIIEMARQAGMMSEVLQLGRNLELLTDFAKLVAEKEREEVERLKALCQEMLSELYVYRASEYLKDVTAAIKAKGLA